MQEIDFNDYFYYDETSPSCLRWRVNVFVGRQNTALKISKDEPAGWLHEGYWIVGLKWVEYRAHNIVWYIHKNCKPVGIVDHFDRVSTNNKIENLREVSIAVNSRNMKKNVNNSTGITGVCIMDKKTKSTNQLSVVAQIRTLDGAVKAKSYSVKKYGLMVAFKMACDWRYSAIDELNSLGAGYSDNHGK